MTLHPDWRRIMLHAWSVRWWLAAIVCGAIEPVLPLIAGDNIGLVILFGGLSTLFGLVGLYARFIAQKEFQDGQTQD